MKPLPRKFYGGSAAQIAPGLLGQWLIRNTPDGPCGGPIVETEAYLFDDPACHAVSGRTVRNQAMFGPPGHAYVYFIYGCHFCVNAVCSPEGVGEAVLIRAIEPKVGTDLMHRFRPHTLPRALTNGPAKLCQALGIDRSLDGVDLCDGASALYIARNPQLSRCFGELGPVVTSPRIGITRAASLPLRFYFAKSPFLSRRHR